MSSIRAGAGSRASRSPSRFLHGPQCTIEDPKTWTRPWTYSLPFTEDDTQAIFEYACHEGNYGLRNILSAGRSDDRKGIKSSDSVDRQNDLRDVQE